MSQIKLEKLIQILEKLCKNGFKVTDAMRRIGIHNESILARRIFLDITSIETFTDYISHYGIKSVHAENSGMIEYICNKLIFCPIDSKYLARMFELRMLYAIEINRYPALAPYDLELESVRYFIDELSKAGMMVIAKSEWCGLFLSRDDYSYRHATFFLSQAKHLNWEDLMVD